MMAIISGIISFIVPALGMVWAYFRGVRQGKKESAGKMKLTSFTIDKTGLRSKVKLSSSEFKYMVLALEQMYEHQEYYERCAQLRDLIYDLERLEKYEEVSNKKK